jgi:hypothetical protein
MPFNTELIDAVLTEATERRNRGELPQNAYEIQIDRIQTEELEACGLLLLTRELPNGITRFLIKDERTGNVQHMIECAPAHVTA